MKPLRWVYYAVMAFSLIAGMYSGLRVYYIIFFTQLFAVITILAVSIWTVQTFRFKQELSRKSLVKGEEAVLHLEIINEKPFPLSLMEVHVAVVALSENVRLVFSLAPFSGRTFEIPVKAPYRGRYNIGMTKLKITDIFGLISFPFDMRRLSYYHMPELIVLPRAQAPGRVSADIADAKSFGDAYLKHAETGDSVSGARLYYDGDALKRIHWKKSAQQGELFVKQYEYPERESVMIMADTAAHGLSGEDLLFYADTICECAACVALHSLSRNRSVRVINSAGFGFPIDCDSLSRFETLRRSLALLPFENEAALHGALEKESRSGKGMYELFVLTRGGIYSMQALERTLTAFRSVTLILVGGPKTVSRFHTIYVDTGSNAAESLRSLL